MRAKIRKGTALVVAVFLLFNSGMNLLAEELPMQEQTETIADEEPSIESTKEEDRIDDPTAESDTAEESLESIKSEEEDDTESLDEKDSMPEDSAKSSEEQTEEVAQDADSGSAEIVNSEGIESEEAGESSKTEDNGSISAAVQNGVASALGVVGALIAANDETMAIAKVPTSFTFSRKGDSWSYYPSGDDTGTGTGIWVDNENGAFVQCGSSGPLPPMNSQIGVGHYNNEVTLSCVVDTNVNVRKVMYYGIGGPGEWSGWKTISYSGAGAYSFKPGGDTSEYFYFKNTWQSIAHNATHEALSSVNTRNSSKAEINTRTNITGCAEFLAFIATAPEPPDSFVVLRYNGSTDTQDMFTWRDYPEGYLKIRKESSNPNLVESNANYSITGTQYKVYASRSNAQNNRNALGTLTVQANGSSNTLTLEAGTYYLKETKAGAGYKLDETIHEVTVESGETKTEKLTDIPMDDPVPIRIIKESLGMRITESNAVFKIEYFDNYTGTGTADRTWYFETSNGTLNLNGITEDQFADGYHSDALFKDSRGTATGLLGTYIIREEKAPEGYKRTEDSLKAVLKADPSAPEGYSWTYEGSRAFQYSPESNTATVENTLYIGEVIFNKNNNTPEGNATMAGIQITIQNKSGHSIQMADGTIVADDADLPTKVTLNAAGTGSISLPYGTYEARETAGNDYYAINTDWRQEFTVGANGNDPQPVAQSLSLTDTIYHGGLRVYKQDADLSGSTPQGDASLAGAQYTIWNASTYAVTVNGKQFAPGSKITNVTLTTNVQGIAQTTADLLPLGTYRLQETMPSAGYVLPDPNPMYTVTIGPTQKNTIVDVNAAAKTPEPVIRGNVRLLKVDSELMQAKTQGKATLAGAEIAIYNNSSNTVVKPDGTRVTKGAVYEVLTTDENGACSLEGLPYGSYYAKETKPSAGYNLNSSWRVDFQIRTEGATVNMATGSNRLPEDVIRGDLSFIKVNIDGNYKGNIPFLISMIGEDGTVKESHVIVSDANGYVNTATRSYTDAKVNSMDQYYIDGKFSDSSKLDPTVGIWFGSENGRAAGRGALVYGTYRITELQCADNEQKEEDLLQSEVFAVTEEGVTITYPVLVDLTVHLSSEALDANTGTKIATVSKQTKLTDTVRYDHLKTSSSYTMETVFYNIRLDGSRVELGRASIDFTPEKVDTTNTAYGTVTTTVTCDTSGVEQGSTLVAVDFLYEHIDGNTILIAAHEDYRDENQMLYIPVLSTTAADSQTLDHVGALEEASIQDVMIWKNFPDAKMFRITGVLKDRETGETLKNTDGEDIMVIRYLRINWSDVEVTQKGFYWQGPKDGVLEMPPLTLDASQIAGRTIVVCETVTDMDTGDVFISHESLIDEEQSIYYVDVHTTATDGKTEDHVGTVGKTETIVDQVQVDNLLVGQTYIVRGTLHYQEDFMDADGVEHKAGDPFGTEQSIAFEATDSSMVVELTFEVDSTLLEGTTVVVFEDVYHNDVKVASHADLTDEEQSIFYPKVRTSAWDGYTNVRLGKIGEEAVIVDTVLLKNLIPDEEYEIIGTLYDSEGNPFLIDGEPVTETVTLVAHEKDTSLDMAFKFDGSQMAGKTLVVYQKLMHDSVEVARHEDPTDETETIHYPDLHTNAMDYSTQDHVASSAGEQIITDLVSYENVLPGMEYTVRGILLYQEDFTDEDGNEHKAGEPVLDAAGEPYQSEKTWVAEEAGGQITLEYTVDSRKLQGATLVIGERLYYEGINVVSHVDLSDEEQTVWYPDVHTTATDGKTEDHNGTVGKMETIVDQVQLDNLIVGQIYTVKGTLHYQEDFMDADGNRHKAGDPFGEEVSTTFEAADSSMIVELVYEVDSTQLAGATVVVFEDLYHNDVKVASHADLNDEEQSIHYPSVHTSAKDGYTDTQTGVSREEAIIIDTVILENLIAGNEYHLHGTLHTADGELFFVDGKPVEAEAIFIAEAKDMSIDLTFTFDGRNLNGQTLVVYEDLLHVDVTVATHSNPDDKDQTIGYPDVHTTATDGKTGSHSGTIGKTETIVDQVQMENLIVGQTYTVSGTLHYQEDFTDIAGDDHKAGDVLGTEQRVTFEASASSMVIELTFKVDSTVLEGTTVVAFEDLYHNDVKVGSHADLTDEEQSVHYPKIWTMARDDADGDQTVEYNSVVILRDRVEYRNLIPGQTYVMRGILMNKATGKPFLDRNGTTEKTVEAEFRFTPKTRNGWVTLPFTFNTYYLDNADLVVFESLYMETIEEGSEETVETLVTEHADLGDKDQTVHVTERPSVKTGDSSQPMTWLLLMLGTGAIIVLFVGIRRRILR